MKSLMVHYKNKYPGAKVIASEDALDVHLKDGSHAVAMRKNGAGQLVCVSEELGCSDRHDLAPIPKDSRVHKVIDGKIGRDEKAEEREKAREQFLCKAGLKVRSCEELKAEGFEFDEKQRLISGKKA